MNFLQRKEIIQQRLKQSFSGDRKKTSIITLVVLLLAIPIALWLLQRYQIFAPRAADAPIQLVTGEDSCVISTDPNKVSCASFPIKLTSPFGAPPEEGAICTSDSQCAQGMTCFNFENYPGVCKPSDTVCTQVITRACHSIGPSCPTCQDDRQECVDFPNPCVVPPGWTVVPNNCTTNAISKTPQVLANNQIEWTYTYPETTKIKKVNFPALANVQFNVNGQEASSGAALNVDLGEGSSVVKIKVTTDDACFPFTAPFTMVNSCNTNMSDFVAMGSVGAYGAVCQASPSPSASAVCSVNASGVSSSVISNRQISYTLTYPTASKITAVNMPATPGYAFKVNDQVGVSGAALNANLGEGAETVVITVTGDEDKACSPFFINYTLTNACGRTFPRFLGPGSAGAYGAVCQAASPSLSPSPSPAASSGGSSGVDELGVNLSAVAQCQNGAPVVVFSNGARNDTPNFQLVKNGNQPLSYFFSGFFTRPPTTQMKDTNVTFGTQYSYHIVALDGPLATKKSNTYTVTTPSSCAGAGIYQPLAISWIRNVGQSLKSYIADLTQSLSSAINSQVLAQINDPVACMKSTLSLGDPLTAANKNNTTLLYWKNLVPLAQLKTAATECGVTLLNPTNFTPSVLENLVRGSSPAESRFVHIEGPCNDTKLTQYQTAGMKISPDSQCNTPDTELVYKVFPPTDQPNQFEGVNDFGGSADPAVVVAATNSPSPTASPSCSNLVKNFSFENPAVTRNNNSWQLFESADPTNGVVEKLPDWDSKAESSGYQVEVQRATSGPAAEGLQYAEIDIPGVISLTQSVPTEAGQQYEIKLKYSPRPGVTGSQKLGVYWNGLEIGTVDGTTQATTGLDWQEKTFTVSGTVGASKLGFGALAGTQPGSGNLIDEIVVTQISGACDPNVSPSASPSPSGEAPIGTVAYRMAETEAGLETAPTFPYTGHPVFTDFDFEDPRPGSKQIWVEFFSARDTSQVEHISVELVEPDPVITSLDCNMDLSRENLQMTIKGSRFGTASGKVTSNTKEAQILSWNASEVVATIKPGENLEDGKLFKVVLTKSDNVALPEVTCRVNTTLISLGARLFCREPGTFDVPNVKVTLVDEIGSKAEETVTIDQDGIIDNLKTVLQVGKTYVISIKAPYSVRRNAQFVADSGTNVITPSGGGSFILPIGDIAPVILSDGKINTLDRAEITRQWSVLGTGTKGTGDFNRDTKINSIDWACMRYDFNEEDDPIPTRAVVTPSSSPAPVASSTPSSSTNPSPSAVPSGQGKAFFLLQPVGAGSYLMGTEFGVDVAMSSSSEAVNLLVAKFAFPKDTLEVVRIEEKTNMACTRGTCSLSWAEKFFDNQAGVISLTAGIPNPALQTSGNDTPVMARIIFKGKQVGTASITLTSNSKIYTNSDNENILGDLVSQSVGIISP